MASTKAAVSSAKPEATVEKVVVSAFTVPTDAPEADGTLEWDSTTMVLAEVTAGSVTGLGWTYAQAATAGMARHLGEKCVLGGDAMDIPAAHARMLRQVRNDGSCGVGAMAISALDIALWDLKARLLGVAVSTLLGRAEESVLIYGSGGFTTYSDKQMTEQLGGWAAQGIGNVKIKVGTHPEDDPRRVKLSRKIVGPEVNLFVDANGAYAAKQALRLAEVFAEQNVVWFEEPVSSDHLEQLHLIRRETPAGMEVAAGEYGYTPFYFRRMLEAGAVDVMQADATRCRGFTGFLEAAAIAGSFGTPLSAHCAPSLHMHAGCAVPGFRHIEYFHDHERIERMFFDGFVEPVKGRLKPDVSAEGLGLVLRRKVAEKYAL